MASFISILKRIGSTVLAAEHVVAPITEALVPAAAGPIAAIDGIFQRVQASIATVEAANPVDGQGQVKAAAVTQDFEAGISLTQQVLALKGEKLTYDDAALQAAIAAQVAAFNAFAALKASFKVVPIA